MLFVAIHFITGRIGGGKGLYCMKLLEAEVRDTNRKIVTNFPLLMDEFAHQLHEKYGEAFDILTRIHLIESKNEIRNFYRIRGQEHEDEETWLEAEFDKKGKAVAYDIDTAFQTGGTFYLLDEIHLVFGARDWQEMGRAVLYYSSQSRKLGDDLLLVTQVPGHVDAQLRNLSQDFTVLRNHSLEKIGWFKQPDVFSRKTYLNMPRPGGKEEPQETSHFKLDLNFAGAYRTEAGIGIMEKADSKDGVADKGVDRRTGLRWYWLLIAIAVLAVGAFFAVTSGVGYFFKEVSDSAITIAGGGVDKNATDNNNGTLARVRAVLAGRMAATNAALAKIKSSNETVIKQSDPLPGRVLNVLDEVTNMVEGYAFTKYRGIIKGHFYLTSGRIINTGDGSVVEISRERIVDKNGKVYLFRPNVNFDPRSLMDSP